MIVLPDVLIHGLDIVFCGTAAGTASARRGAYYAGPGNAFWPTLFKTGLTPRLFKPEEYPIVVEYGLGMTDLAKTVYGPDHTLSADHFARTRLRDNILEYQPCLLAFTGKRAAGEFLDHRVDYGLQRQKVGNTRLFVLPSPSGAARRYWNEDWWYELARLRSISYSRDGGGI